VRQLIDILRLCRDQLVRHKLIAVGTTIVCTVGVGTFGVAFASSVNAGSQATTQPSTEANTLNETELEAVALNASRAAGDETPTELQAVRTTVLDGAMTLSPPGSNAPTEDPAAQVELSKQAELEVLHGHFVLTHASVPPGRPIPTGSVLSLVVDTETGAIVFTALNNRGPSQGSLEALGRVSDVADPASSAGQS
jgi:hypothetical protein